MICHPIRKDNKQFMNKLWNELTIYDAVMSNAYNTHLGSSFIVYNYEGKKCVFSSNYTIDSFQAYIFETSGIKKEDCILIACSLQNDRIVKMTICGKDLEYTFDSHSLPILPFLPLNAYRLFEYDFGKCRGEDFLYYINKEYSTDDSLFHVIEKNTRECTIELKCFYNQKINLTKADVVSISAYDKISHFLDPRKPKRTTMYTKINHLYEKYKDEFEYYDSLSSDAKLKLKLGGKLTKDDLKEEI